MKKHLWFKLWVGVLNQGLCLVATKCHWLIKGLIALLRQKQLIIDYQQEVIKH